MLDKLFKTIEKITPVKYRWILNHDGFKRYFANTGWMFFGQMFSLSISFFIGAWIARYLGPDSYGVLSYAVAFVGLFGFIASLGVDGILNRELVKFPEKRNELLGTAFRLKLIGGTFAFLLAVTGAFLFQTDFLTRCLIIIFSITFILQAINVVSIYFQAEVKSKKNVKVLLVATIISSILKVAVILLNQGVIWIMIVYVLDSLFQAIGFINSYKNNNLKIKDWRYSKSISKEILINSWPLMLAYASGFIFSKVDQIIIGKLLNNRDVGIYAVAVRLVEIWYFIPVVICSSLFPAIVNAKKTDFAVYKRRLNNLYFLMIIISFVITIFLSLFAKPIVYLLFGNGYLESVNILRIYIWSNLGLFLGFAINQYLMSENLVKNIFFLYFLAMLINVALNILFIPIIGLAGAAWATVISCLVIPLGILFIKKRRKH